MKMKLKIIPQEIIYQYHLQDLQENGRVYMKIVKVLEVILIYDFLRDNL